MSMVSIFNLPHSRWIVAWSVLLAGPGLLAQQPPATQQRAARSGDAPAAADLPVSRAMVTPIQSAAASPFVLTSAEQSKDAPAVREDELRQQLQGKTFYLRSGHLDNTLHFDEQGHLRENSPQAPYTLSLVEIQRVRIEKHRIEMEAVRYGLHFLEASPTEDMTAAIDRVRLTAKKKPLIITIDREEVVKPKKEKEKHEKGRGPQSAGDSRLPASTGATPSSAASPADEVEGRHGVETTSQAQANRTLAQALDNIFATGIDERMMAALPDFWQRYYKSVADRHAWKPSEPNVLRQSEVDQKAKLISVVDPPSNEFAQNNGVAGVAMYHVVLGADGKPQEIAVGRPIGFGLDENAVKAIREARFQPAMKGGQPVPVMLDLVVQFRIYSKRTAEASNHPAAQPGGPELPGPYTANAPRPQPAPEAAPQPAAQPDTGQQPAASAAPAQEQAQPPAQQPATPPAQQPQ
jgi:TonB family protein